MGRHRGDVANLHVTVVYEDASAQEFHQGPLPRTWGLRSSALDPRTTRVDGRPPACRLGVPSDLRLQRRFPGRQGGLVLFQVLAPPLILGAGGHLAQRRLGQAIALMG